MRKLKVGKRRLEVERVREIEQRLKAAYGQPDHHNPTDPLDDLVFVVLSRMTQEVKYKRTYDALRDAYPSWQLVREAPAHDVELVLKDAGLAPTKTRHLQSLLEEIESREHRLDLGRLGALSDQEVEDYLTSLPGVALKTAQCVMLYALGRDVCPVDTHVWRVSQRLGLAPPGLWSERKGRALEASLPTGIRGSLHRTLVAHGRAVCIARAARCDLCVIAELCPAAQGATE